MNEPERDDDFDRLLQQRSPLLQRLSRLDADEPPSDLDRIVLARARSEIGAPREESRPLRLRWAFPVALAATLVIAFSVVLQMGLPRLTGTNDTVPVVSERELVRDAASESAAAASAPASGPAPASTSADTIGDAESAARSKYDAAEVHAEPPTFAQAPPREVVASPPPPPLPIAAPESPAPALAAPATVASDAAVRDAVEQDEAAVPPPSDRAERASRFNRAAGASAAMERKAAATAMRPADEWLAYIRELRARGETAAADAEWDAFRKAYPDHPAVRANASQP